MDWVLRCWAAVWIVRRGAVSSGKHTPALPFPRSKSERETKGAGNDAADSGETHPARACHLQHVEQQVERDLLMWNALPGAHTQRRDKQQTQPCERQEQHAADEPPQPQQSRRRAQIRNRRVVRAHRDGGDNRRATVEPEGRHAVRPRPGFAVRGGRLVVRLATSAITHGALPKGVARAALKLSPCRWDAGHTSLATLCPRRSVPHDPLARQSSSLKAVRKGLPSGFKRLGRVILGVI